tara:strand:- start:4691 stop:5545 length:855 start_codon:yes stop_codon:yes gene_type:complete
MAWRFPQEYARDGDVIEPSDWRTNLNETLSELNGYLDRDNLREKFIGAEGFERETFTLVRSNHPNSEQSFLFNMEEAGWLKETIVIRDTQTYSNSPQQVGMHPYYINVDVLEMDRYGTSPLPSVVISPNTSGLLIAEFSGTVDWVGKSSNSAQTSESGGLTHPGISEEYSYFAPQDKKYKQLSAFIQCSMWRLTVDGQTIAETGPIGNEYSSHPIYLCGATPVTNRDQIKVQLEGRFVWYSPGTNSFKSASGFAPKALKKDDDQGVRTDCVLSCPNLIVTFRKR